MTEAETYLHGSNYENFIRRAFKCDRGKHGAENAYFKLLLMSDIGKDYLSKPYDKQLSEVKKHLNKAVDKFLSRKPTEDEKNFLILMKSQIEGSRNATSLVPIIISGIDNTIRYRNM